jgi:hypothetical protein
MTHQEEVEDRIKEIFQQNYEMMKLEGGHAMTNDVAMSALEQVLYYYRKMKFRSRKSNRHRSKIKPSRSTNSWR